VLHFMGGVPCLDCGPFSVGGLRPMGSDACRLSWSQRRKQPSWMLGGDSRKLIFQFKSFFGGK